MSFIDNIKEIPITDYAERCGFTLVRKGGRYVSIKEHDSVMIDVTKNCFWRNSVFQSGAKGGAGSVIDFAMEFMGYDRNTALRELAVMYNVSGDRQVNPQTYSRPTPKPEQAEPKRAAGDLELPPKADNLKRVYHYLLNERKIDLSVVRYFVSKKMLYQDARHGNCVFVTDKFGCMRSTGGTRFAVDLKGCDYNECFYFRPSTSAKSLVVSESVIDVMSVMTQFAREEKSYTDYSYLALAGTNKLPSLFYHLEKDRDIDHVILALDNDEAGQKALEAAVEGLHNMGFDGTVEVYTAPAGKDWNEYIQLTVTSEQGEKQPTHRENEQKNITESEDLKMSEEKQRLFVDMDGTLAVFTPVDEMETLYEQGYFSNLKPHENVVAAIRDIVVNHPEIEVNILSAYLSDSQFALAEKNEWLNQYLPEIDQEHRIFVPCGSDKKEGIVGGIRSNDFLLDDYTKNLNDWQPPARGIKLLNAINHTRGSWEHDRIRYDREPSALSEAIVSVMREEQRIFDDKISADNLDKSAALQKDLTGKPRETVVINAFGGAGAGKTTACMHIAAELKKKGFVAEYVPEYAKELVWDKNLEMLDGSEMHQRMILSEQSRRVERLVGQVDFVVTDAPTILNGVYLKDCDNKENYCKMLLDNFNTYNNFNFVVQRDTKKFEKEGRIHTLEESIAVDGEVEKLLKDNNLFYGKYDHAHLDIVVQNAIKTYERINGAQQPQRKQPLNEVETDTQEQTVSSGQDITITCEWSESPVFEGGKTYSVAEFDRIMAQADKERVEARQTELAKYGSVEEWEATDENSYYRYQSYDKVSFTVNLPNGVTVTERQDIGDGYGGVVDYFRSFTGNSLMSMTANALEAQRDIDNAIRERDELRSVHSEMEKERGDTTFTATFPTLQYVSVSETSTGWQDNGEKDYGYIDGYLRGYNIEFQNKETGEINYSSAIFVERNVENYYQNRIDEWGEIGYEPFETEKNKGLEPTGRAVFRGYYTERYNAEERETFVEDATEEIERMIKENNYMLKSDFDAHRSLFENVEVTHGEQEQAELDNGGNAVTTEQKQEALDKELTQEQLERIVAEKSAPVPIDETLPAKDQLTQRLENGVRQVLDSEQFKNWLSTGGKLFYNNYSFRNAMLVWLQKPDATYVMGYEKWKEYGRNVKQGATGAKIIIPFIANEKTKGGLFRTIKNGLTSQFASNPSLKEAVYRLGASNIEFTMNGSNHLIGLRINGSEKQIFGSDEEVKRFIDRAIIGKVATGFSVGTVFDAKDVIIPEYLWLKSGFTKDEIALDDKGNPIKNRRGETKIINTPERQARFQPSLDTKIVAKDAEKMQLLFEACVAASERKGVPVSLSDKSTDSTLKGGAKGYYSRQFSADKPNGFIVIDNSLEITEKCAVLLHEMGHSDLHKDLKALAEEMGEKNISREMREVQAEATAFAVASTFGIETDASSFKYLAAYARGFDLQEFHKSLEVIFQETQQLTNDIKTELDLKGFNLDLTEKPQGKLEQDTIKSLSKKYVDYATKQTESVQDALNELPHLLEQSEGKADLFEILKQQKQNLDNRKTDIDLLLVTVEKLGSAETRTEQEAAVAVLESTAERINTANMNFDSLTEQFVIASEQTRSGLKEDFLRNPYETLCKMRTDFPELSTLTDPMLQYVATSKVVSRDLSPFLKNNPQAFVDKAMERAGLLIKVASQSGTFVEINFCEQWTDKPFFENGTLCSPKVADKIISSCEMQVRGFKEQAAKTGDYFPYVKCDMTIFTPSKDGKLLSLNTRVNIGDGEQASLKEHLEKECQRGERKDIFENFSVALQERALKSQLIVQDLSSKSEPPQAEIESPAKDTEKGMNSAEWEKAINNKKGQLTQQSDKSNTQEMNAQKGER